jgi:SNF2 family DNA or RNA helicase
LKHELRKYQREGVNFLKQPRGTALLADQQGLGKTIQVITACKELDIERILVVCPKPVISVWEQEIPIWDTSARAVPLLGTPAQKTRALKEGWAFQGRTYFITNWETLLQASVPLANLPWHCVVADEAHRIKNRKAKRTKALKKIRTQRKFAATGTPFDKNPDELWSLLNWLSPGRWKSYWQFYNSYLEWTDTPWGREITGLKSDGKLLEADIQPWVLRRLKSQVLTELPPKQYQYIWCNLSKTQYEIYQQLSRDFLAEFDGITVETPGVLARLTRFRQLTASPAVLDADLPDDSLKLDAVADYISDMDEPVVVFSCFVDSLWLLADRIGKFKEKRPVWIYTGDTSHEDKKQFIEQFQSQKPGEKGIFLATIGAAGVGITLHRASTVLFIDRDWSPANNEQAEDRVHRMGQPSSVNVVTFAVPKTIDTHVLKLLDEKRETFAKVMAADVIGKPEPPK